MTRWRRAYAIVANSALLIMIVQLGTHAALKSHQALSPRPLTLTAAEEQWLECARLRFRYGGSAGFLHDATASAFVNIDEYGIRSNGGLPRSIAALDRATWVFGGSAAFGCGLADGDTIAAQLERLRSEPVFNLGVRGYNSAMENRLFNHYLRAGYRPRRVLFLDGVEEHCANGLFDSQMTAIAVAMQEDYSWGFATPVRSAIGGVRRWWNRPPDSHVSRIAAAPIECADEGRTQPLAVIVARRLAERTALCRLYAVECHTLVQPVAGVRRGLELIEHLAPTWRDARATFLAGALEAPDRMWLDRIHYSTAGTHHIAGVIDQYLGPRPSVSPP